MNIVISKKELAKDITELTINSPEIARKAKAGQFVVLVVDEKGERIPLTLADWDEEKGTITLVVQKIGSSTNKLSKLEKQDSISHILGPLGHPAEIKNLGEAYCVGGGVGIAEVYPVTRALKEAGNRVIGIIGSRSKDLIIREAQLREACAELFIATDDGSYGKKGFVTDILGELLDVIEKSTHIKFPSLVYAVGPVPMMKAVADLTRGYKIKTIVSINPIMVDATGMCGACRCKVDGKMAFGCVDGPDFDAHKLDFDELSLRLKQFTREEGQIS